MNTVLRKVPPGPLAPIAFDIPAPKIVKLANGLQVVLMEDDRLPLVSLRLAFLRGDIDDPAGSRGLTSAIAAMVTEGTAEYSSRQLAEKAERLGASLTAHTSDDFTVVSASTLSLYTFEVLHLMADVVLRPTFPEEELDLYRRNTIEHLKFQRSQSAFLAGEQAARLVYGHHPYSVVAPAQSDIERLERTWLAHFHRASYIPNNAVLIAVGDIDDSSFVKELEELFGDWQPGTVAAREFQAPPQRAARTLTLVDRPGSAQSNIVLADLAIRRDHPDHFPMLVMNQVLGAGASSRIFMNLREEKGYTYGAYTRLDAKKLYGSFEATAEVRNEVTGASLKEFFFEFERIRAEKVGDGELADAKNFLTGVFPIRAETQEGLTNLIVSQHLYELPADHLQTYREHVAAVTADDVRRVAELYVRPDRMAVVIVGDAGEVMDQIKDYGDSVEIFETDGKKKEV
jgi:zinc protease